MIDQLWMEPTDLATRDLYFGSGGSELAPDPAVPYEFVERDTTGRSPGYDVRGPDGQLWSVKLGNEAQTEVVASRVLWALGFHQPPTYYVETWQLTGQDAGAKQSGRFRRELDSWRVEGEWSWYENPFVGTRPFAGLVVAQLILNNWDLKTSNNKIYEAVDASQEPRRLYVVRDLGASLGAMNQRFWFRWPRFRLGQGNRNDVEGFERSPFIEELTAEEVEFAYSGLDETLVDRITPADVRWACERLARLSDRQWNDAFRAGGYAPDETRRYVQAIKAKIAQGLAGPGANQALRNSQSPR